MNYSDEELVAMAEKCGADIDRVVIAPQSLITFESDQLRAFADAVQPSVPEGWQIVPKEIDRTKHREVLGVWNECVMNSETLEMTWPKLVKAIAAPLATWDGTERRKAVEPDALRYRWLRDDKSNALHITRNADHACNYVTAKEWIEGFGHAGEWGDVAPEELQRMKDTNTIWVVQIYPNTPVGFNIWYGATLDAALDAAMKQGA